MTALCEELLRSPGLGSLLGRLQEVYAEEQRRREEFRQSVTEGEKAEFINGEVVVHSPVRLSHSLVSQALFTLLRAHVLAHGLGVVGHEKLMVSLTRNDYEPDVCFFSTEKAAGFEPHQMRFPAPDFVAEILSPSTEARDRGVKMEDYAAHGVAEYWLLEPEEQVLEQYLLSGETYHLNVRSSTGTVTSTAVPGFVIPIPALFDERENLQTLRVLVEGAR
ncbi:MAG TPA: Uma2 family endonuclease [Armatimonadota bacterium]|jgi:Uma2 family endonuclease